MRRKARRLVTGVVYTDIDRSSSRIS